MRGLGIGLHLPTSFFRFIVPDAVHVHSYDKNRHYDTFKADRVSKFQLQSDCCHVRRQQYPEPHSRLPQSACYTRRDVTGKV
jgi:hypothetical protein